MLLIDAGNSRCKWAWIEDGVRQHQGVLDNVDDTAWQQLKSIFSSLATPRKILISNVAGEQMERRLRELCGVWQCAPEFIVAQAEQCGVRNGYDQPAQLGSDRWAALIAAWERIHGACLVVNCGTATTVDALSATGEFLGGLILPGVELMRHTLLHNTAQLGVRAGDVSEFPRNTADAIASGIMRASIGAIRQQFALLEQQGMTSCILSGGAAAKMLPHLALEVVLVDDLVLQGMQIMGRESLKTT